MLGDWVQNAQLIGGSSGKGFNFSPYQQYGVSMSPLSSGVQITNFSVDNNLTGGLLYNSSSPPIVVNCSGARSYNKGAILFPASGTSVTVNHGLIDTPAREQITLHPLMDLGGKRIWVDPTGPSSFTINVDSAFGGSGAWIGWEAKILTS